MERKREHQGTRRRPRAAARATAAVLALAAVAGTAALSPMASSASAVNVAVTGRISVTSAGAQAVQDLGTWSSISADGRYVAFTSSAALQAGDTNDADDAYLRDRVAGTTTRISVTDADGQIDGWSGVCGMSRSARFVAFVGSGAGLPVPDARQLYLRDRALGTTTLVSRATDGTPAGPGPGGSASLNDADRCAVSDNGRFVAFQSEATNLVPGDLSPGAADVFRRDLQASTTVRVSASLGGTANDDFAGGVSMSSDGNVVAFASNATNLVAGDTNGTADVFVRTVSPAALARANTKADGSQVFGSSGPPTIAGDGTKVAFASNSGNLPNPTGKFEVYVKTRATGAITRASSDTGGGALGVNVLYPWIADDGQHVAFVADLPDNTPDDPNHTDDVYLKDLGTGWLSVISTTSEGHTANGASYRPVIDADGSAVAFASTATDLVRNDTNAKADLFVRDLAVDIAPFVSTTALVKQQFVDFLGRQPSAAELDEWKAKLGNGEKTPDLIIDDLAHGTTFAGKRAPMIRLYWAFFLRAPDKSGLAFWTNRLTNGWTLAKVAKQFAASSEFETKYGSKSNGEFVTLIYQNIFDRDPDPAGLAYWTKKLDTKAKTRGDVMVNFSESSEGRRVLAPQTDTILHYLGMLGTMPSKLFLDLLLGSFKGEWISAEQVAGIRSGAAYAARITP